MIDLLFKIGLTTLALAANILIAALVTMLWTS